jgi:RNA-directed DNA polymerase
MRARWGRGRPETFDFLGFTHISGKARSGRFKVTRITVSKRMRGQLQELKGEIEQWRRHLPIPEQGRRLSSEVQGHLNYYACPATSTGWKRSGSRSSGTGSRRCGVAASDSE